MVDKIHLLVLATFGESHEGDGSVELIFVVARKKREREGEKVAGCTYKAGTHKGLGAPLPTWKSNHGNPCVGLALPTANVTKLTKLS